MIDEMPDEMPLEPGEVILGLGPQVALEDLDTAAWQQGAGEAASSNHGAAAVRLARREHGTKGGDKYERYFGYGHVNWCALFVSWAVDLTGNRDHRLPWGNPAWVPSIHAWAQHNGRLVTTPRHGDIFGLGGQHTGLVAGATPNGSAIFTIEGNITNAVTARNLPSRGLWFARLP
jgi:hypothetical protein